VPLMVCLLVFLPLEDVAVKVADVRDTCLLRMRRGRVPDWDRTVPDG
jgi:hypothetical protein